MCGLAPVRAIIRRKTIAVLRPKPRSWPEVEMSCCLPMSNLVAKTTWVENCYTFSRIGSVEFNLSNYLKTSPRIAEVGQIDE